MFEKASVNRKYKGSHIPAEIFSEYKVLAITGKMAAGKNYICSIFEQYGWFSIDCDLLVHDAIKEATPLIIKTFQPYADKLNITIVDSNGNINRRALGQVLFSDKLLLTKQESIVYPIITNKIKEIINLHPKTIINATVLYKTPELLELCDALIFVDALFLIRLIRAKKRDKLPLKQILSRFKSQKNLFSEYKAFSKTIITINNW